MVRKLLKSWWRWLQYEPNDPRFHAGGVIKVAALGGGTGLANLLRGLKKYSDNISAIVTVTDNGGASTSLLRKEFDMLAPGDIRQCISALAEDEQLFSKLFEYRFDQNKKVLGGHTLGNIWITALTSYFGSFEKAIEVTSEMFNTAGKVLPSTLDNITLQVSYADGTKATGEYHLDESIKKIKNISLTKNHVRAYPKAVAAIRDADLIMIGPGSIYASLIPNLLVPGIRKAIADNKKAVKIYIANCSTERTQTRGYTIDDHLSALKDHSGKNLFNYCLVNSRIIKTSKDETKLGEINNITTEKEIIDGIKIVRADVIDEVKPLYHDNEKLAKAIIGLYNKVRETYGSESNLF